jgi:hypothetical protein
MLTLEVGATGGGIWTGTWALAATQVSSNAALASSGAIGRTDI